MLEILHDLFSYTFIVRALIVGTLVSLCAALLGVSLVLKRYSMIGDGLSHVGFGALAVACLLYTSLSKADFESGATYLSLMKQNVENLKKGLE